MSSTRLRSYRETKPDPDTGGQFCILGFSYIGLAELGGYERIFVDEDPSMAGLLYQIAAQIDQFAPLISQDYVQDLLAAFPEVESQAAQPPQIQPHPNAWIEPLTEREIDVLRLIVAGLKNQEIAARLYLSLNTVKAHTRSIYSKLNVNSRTQAVAKAGKPGLITKN